MGIKNKKYTPVSIIMPMRNAKTTVLLSLKSIATQKYPICEILVIDNASEDDSLEVVSRYKRRTKLPIRIIARAKNGGFGSSCNLGIKNAKSSLVVLMHSDCALPTENELEKLTEPMRKNPTVLITFPTIILPQKIWDTYDFWEKCLFSRIAGKGSVGPAAKFDCIKRDAFLQVGGFDTVNFGVGGEDMDLALKISKLGKLVLSDARVTHLQYLGRDFGFQRFLKKNKQHAMNYGGLIRKRYSLLFGKSIILLSKPFLAILPLIPVINEISIPIFIIYAFIFTHKMFTTKSTLTDWKIITVLPVYIFLIYYETFWMIESFFFGKNRIE